MSITRRPRFSKAMGNATMLALCLMAGSARAATLDVAYSFLGGHAGAAPAGGVVLDRSGNAFGVTLGGGRRCRTGGYTFAGCGTVYRLDPTGEHHTLAVFDGSGNGAIPFGGLALSNHVLFGGTEAGGKADYGTVFSIHDNGTEFSLLHSFTGVDGALSVSTPVLAADGGVFIIALEGGIGFLSSKPGSGFGVLAEIQPDGTYAAKHSFTGGTDGGAPGPITADSAGHIFGTTSIGGGTCSATLGSSTYTFGCGLVYEFDPATNAFTMIATFKGGGRGFRPVIGSIDSRGNIYGVTEFGGNAGGYGTLFELKKTSVGFRFITLYAFTGGTDGAMPSFPPTLSATGALVGITGESLYSFADDVLTTLHTFAYDTDGGYPTGQLSIDPAGVIHGTALYGGVIPCNSYGISGCGVVYTYGP